MRIFPLYWVAVVALFLSDTGGFRDVFLWHASYLSNILFYDQGFSGPAIHFWTLSVEEQFYLVFPFAVLFADRKLLVPVLLLGILIAPVFRGTFGNIERNWLLLPASFDSFGIGALVGVLMSQRWTRRAGMFVMCAAGFLLYGAGTLGTGLGVLKKTAVALMLGGVVWQASGGFGGVIGRILSGPILGYIGRVSYGVYVIHLFAPEIWTWLLFKAPVPGYRIAERLGCPQVLLGSRTVTLMGWTGVTILLTAISFRFLELPCNRLKKRFPYVKPGLEA